MMASSIKGRNLYWITQVYSKIWSFLKTFLFYPEFT